MTSAFEVIGWASKAAGSRGPQRQLGVGGLKGSWKASEAAGRAGRLEEEKVLREEFPISAVSS